jgi:hypothetical protein
MRNGDSTKFVQVRVPHGEKRAWRETARRLDLTVAQLVRRAVRAEVAATSQNAAPLGNGTTTVREETKRS